MFIAPSLHPHHQMSYTGGMRTSFSRWLTGPVIIGVLVVVVALYAGGKYNGFITQVDSGDLAAAPPAEAVPRGGGSKWDLPGD